MAADGAAFLPELDQTPARVDVGELDAECAAAAAGGLGVQSLEESIEDDVVATDAGKVLGVVNAADTNGARVLQWSDNGTTDHEWRLRYAADGYFRIECGNGRRVLGVSGGSTTGGAQIVLWDDSGSTDQRWRFV